jgi:hypothetical protein
MPRDAGCTRTGTRSLGRRPRGPRLPRSWVDTGGVLLTQGSEKINTAGTPDSPRRGGLGRLAEPVAMGWRDVETRHPPATRLPNGRNRRSMARRWRRSLGKPRCPDRERGNWDTLARHVEPGAASPPPPSDRTLRKLAPRAEGRAGRHVGVSGRRRVSMELRTSSLEAAHRSCCVRQGRLAKARSRPSCGSATPSCSPVAFS